jgi:hypothetical protein
MPVSVITTSTTTLCKQGPGYLNDILITAPGTTWGLRILDGPDSSGNFKPIMGSTAFTIPAIGTILLPSPVYFGQGLTLITSGATPGEIEAVWT